MVEIGTHLASSIALFLAAIAATRMETFRDDDWDGVILLGSIVAAVAGFLSTFDWRFLVVGVVGTVAFVVADPDRGSAGGDESEQTVDRDSLLEEPSRTFEDVGGMDDLKSTLRERVIRPVRNPDRYEAYGLGATDGVLLYGPPGCGKTYVAGALAGELGFNYVEVSPADLVSKWIGQGSKNVARAFEIAEENAPCLLFIDEIDAIASNRSGDSSMTNSEKQMVNQLLTELQSVPDDVVVLAATNYVDDIDDAILRSGRFDERIEVPPPDPVAREEIVSLHLPEGKTDPAISLDDAVAATAGYASSDLELVAELAARHAMVDRAAVTDEHVEAAIAETSTSISGWLHRYEHLDGGDAAGTSVAQPDGTNLAAAEIVDPNPGLSFDDVAGMDEQKSALVDRLIEPLANADRYATLGVDGVDGVLMYGPPGCGKGTLSRALAGELGLPIASITPDSFVEHGDADPTELVEDAFRVAKANAPCVLSIEDVHAIAPSDASSNQGGEFARFVAKHLRAIEDHDVVVVGTAATPELVNESVLSSGCFDERIEVPIPDSSTRRAVLRDALDERVVADDFDWDRAVAELDDYTISDIEVIAESAARTAVREDRDLAVADIREHAAETGSSAADWSFDDADDADLPYIV